MSIEIYLIFALVFGGSLIRSQDIHRKWTRDNGKWTLDDGKGTLDDGKGTLDDGNECQCQEDIQKLSYYLREAERRVEYLEKLLAKLETSPPTTHADSDICGSTLHYLEPVSPSAASRGFDALCYISSEETDSSLVSTQCEDLLEQLPGGWSDSAALLGAGGNYGCWRSSLDLDDGGREGACQKNYQHTGRLSDCSHCTYFFVCIDFPNVTTQPSVPQISSTTLAPSSSAPVDSGICGSTLHYLEPVSPSAASRGFDALCYISSEEADSSLVSTQCEDLLEQLPGGWSDSASLLGAGGNYGCWRSSLDLDDGGREGACQKNYQHTGRLSDCSHCTYFFVCIDFP